MVYFEKLKSEKDSQIDQLFFFSKLERERDYSRGGGGVRILASSFTILKPSLSFFLKGFLDVSLERTEVLEHIFHNDNKI